MCGCNGTTYSNDCLRIASGVLKYADGACVNRDAGARTYPTAYLAWQVGMGFTGRGPAVIVTGAERANTWNSVPPFSPETAPANPSGSFTLTAAQTDDLFARLASVNVSALPHAATTLPDCAASFYYRSCATCGAVTLSYNVSTQVTPEMESVWSWFDQVLGATTATNPRRYCAF